MVAGERVDVAVFALFFNFSRMSLFADLSQVVEFFSGLQGAAGKDSVIGRIDNFLNRSVRVERKIFHLNRLFRRYGKYVFSIFVQLRK